MTAESRSIARTALDYSFNPSDHASSTNRAHVVEAIAGYRQALRPACQLTKAEAAGPRQTLAQLIGQIGLRIRPDLNADQAKLWTASMVDALDQHPLVIAIAAAKDAKAVPMRHPSEVLDAILARMDGPRMRHERAMRNLQRLLHEIDHPTPKLEAPPTPELTHEELQALPESLRRIGLAAGWLRLAENGDVEWTGDQASTLQEPENRERIDQ